MLSWPAGNINGLRVDSGGLLKEGKRSFGYLRDQLGIGFFCGLFSTFCQNKLQSTTAH
jgi:hypothetical protein